MIEIDQTDYPDGSSLISHVSPMCCVDMAIDPRGLIVTVDAFDVSFEIPLIDIHAWIEMLQRAEKIGLEKSVLK